MYNNGIVITVVDANPSTSNGVATKDAKGNKMAFMNRGEMGSGNAKGMSSMNEKRMSSYVRFIGL